MNNDQKYYPVQIINKKEADAFAQYLEDHHIYFETVCYPKVDLIRFNCLMYIDEAEAAGHWLEEYRGGRKK